MTFRLNEKQITISQEPNKIPLLTGNSLGNLDGSQLTNLNFSVPANTKAIAYGGSPTFGTDTINILPNKCYHADGLSSNVAGTYTLTQTFVDSAVSGDLVYIVVHKDCYINVANSVSSTHLWVVGNVVVGATPVRLSAEKGAVIIFRVWINPINNTLNLFETSESAFSHWDDLRDVDFLTNAVVNADCPRYNGVNQKWENRKTVANREIVITDANINNYISYDRFFDTGVRETDGPYFRLSQISDLETDGSFDHLHIIWQAENIVINGVSTPITNAKIVLPNINSFWIMKSITTYLDSVNLTLNLILEKTPQDNSTYIENSNYTTTPIVSNIANFQLNSNIVYAYRPTFRLMATGWTDFIPNFPDDAATSRKSWIMI